MLIRDALGLQVLVQPFSSSGNALLKLFFLLSWSIRAAIFSAAVNPSSDRRHAIHGSTLAFSASCCASSFQRTRSNVSAALAKRPAVAANLLRSFHCS